MKTVIEFAQQLLDPSPLGAVTLIALATLTVAYRAMADSAICQWS